MNAINVVVMPELVQLPLKINRVPEERVIEILAPNRPDQPFNERVRNRGIGHRLDLLDLEYAQVSKSPVESEQRIVISADAFRKGLAGNRVVEHSTHGYSVDVAPVVGELSRYAAMGSWNKPWHWGIHRILPNGVVQ